ncbi:MAG: hypothetical protein ACERKZ_20295 [Lachnotalea sp.]
MEKGEEAFEDNYAKTFYRDFDRIILEAIKENKNIRTVSIGRISKILCSNQKLY